MGQQKDLEEKYKYITVRVPYEQAVAIRKEANAENVSISALILSKINMVDRMTIEDSLARRIVKIQNLLNYVSQVVESTLEELDWDPFIVSELRWARKEIKRIWRGLI